MTIKSILKLSRILLILSGLECLAGCGKISSTVDVMPTNDHDEISFSTDITKSMVNSTAESAFKTAGVGLFGSNADGERTFPDNTHLSWEAGTWFYSPLAYWTDSDRFRFAAVWPYAESGPRSSASASFNPSTGALVMDCTSGIDKNAVDLMYATTSVASADYAVLDAKNNPVSYNRAPLMFKHAFAAVSLKVVNATGNTLNSVGYNVASGLALSGVEYKGTATVSPEGVLSWALNGEKSTNQYSSTKVQDLGASPTPQNLFEDEYFLVLPQRVAATDIMIQFWDGTRTVHSNLRDAVGITEWQAGKKYNYSLTITSKYITIAVSVVDWITDEYELL